MVSMQLGPLSLFLIRSTLRGTLAIGLAIGAGIAIVDALYATAGAAGAASALSIDSVRTVLGLVGAAVLVALGHAPSGARSGSAWAGRHRLRSRARGARSRRRSPRPLRTRSRSPRGRAVFAAASTAGIAGTTDSAIAFVAGVGLGSMAWVTILALSVSAARARVGPRLLKTLDAAAGSAIVAFGGLLAWRTLRESS